MQPVVVAEALAEAVEQREAVLRAAAMARLSRTIGLPVIDSSRA